MAKIYVIDTSALISNPNVVKKARRHGVIIPAVVLRQLDGLKNSSNGNTAYWARKASQAIERQQRKNNFLIEGASLAVNPLDNAADNEIIGTALYVKGNVGHYTSSKVKDVVLVSTDRNMRIAAGSYGLTTEEALDSGKVGAWRTILLSSYSYLVLPLVLAIINQFWIPLNLSEGTCAMMAIIWPVSLIIAIIAACKYHGYTYGEVPNMKDRNEEYYDMEYDPAFSQTYGNIYHHRDR